jgi:hypothetical protein
MDSISRPEAPGKEKKSLAPVVGSPGQNEPVGKERLKLRGILR